MLRSTVTSSSFFNLLDDIIVYVYKLKVKIPPYRYTDIFFEIFNVNETSGDNATIVLICFCIQINMKFWKLHLRQKLSLGVLKSTIAFRHGGRALTNKITQ